MLQCQKTYKMWCKNLVWSGLPELRETTVSGILLWEPSWVTTFSKSTQAIPDATCWSALRAKRAPQQSNTSQQEKPILSIHAGMNRHSVRLPIGMWSWLVARQGRAMSVSKTLRSTILWVTSGLAYHHWIIRDGDTRAARWVSQSMYSWVRTSIRWRKA